MQSNSHIISFPRMLYVCIIYNMYTKMYRVCKLRTRFQLALTHWRTFFLLYICDEGDKHLLLIAQHCFLLLLTGNCSLENCRCLLRIGHIYPVWYKWNTTNLILVCKNNPKPASDCEVILLSSSSRTHGSITWPFWYKKMKMMKAGLYIYST